MLGEILEIFALVAASALAIFAGLVVIWELVRFASRLYEQATMRREGEKPRLELVEGHWYARADGKVFGPMVRREPTRYVMSYVWTVPSGSELWTDDGQWSTSCSGINDLVREVPPPECYEASRLATEIPH